MKFIDVLACIAASAALVSAAPSNAVGEAGAYRSVKLNLAAENSFEARQTKKEANEAKRAQRAQQMADCLNKAQKTDNKVTGEQVNACNAEVRKAAKAAKESAKAAQSKTATKADAPAKTDAPAQAPAESGKPN